MEGRPVDNGGMDQDVPAMIKTREDSAQATDARARSMCLASGDAINVCAGQLPSKVSAWLNHPPPPQINVGVMTVPCSAESCIGEAGRMEVFGQGRRVFSQSIRAPPSVR